jgi:hypothetical protein
MSKRLPRRDGSHVWVRARQEAAMLGLDDKSREYVHASVRSRWARMVPVCSLDVVARTVSFGPEWTCSRCGQRVRMSGRPGHFRKPLCKDTVVETVMET